MKSPPWYPGWFIQYLQPALSSSLSSQQEGVPMPFAVLLDPRPFIIKQPHPDVASTMERFLDVIKTQAWKHQVYTNHIPDT